MAPEARERRRKQQKARRLAMYSTMVVFVLVVSFGIVKVIEMFSADEGEVPLLDGSTLQQPNTDVEKQGEDWDTFTGPVENTINLEVVIPEINMIQVAENGRVDISYFNDAIFMGDSLADGFRVYSGSGSLDLRNTAATYITRQSLTPRSFTQPGAMIDVGDGPIDPWATVEQKNPGKVYVTLGTNALMSMDPQEFIDSYYVFIDMLKEKAPNAVIYVTTITPTTGWKAREEPRLSFDRIYQANQLIAKMCNEKDLALINLYDVLKSDSGYLREEIARSDGYHLTPTGYQESLDYLITHTVYNPSSPYIPGSPYAQTI